MQPAVLTLLCQGLAPLVPMAALQEMALMVGMPLTPVELSLRAPPLWP